MEDNIGNSRKNSRRRTNREALPEASLVFRVHGKENIKMQFLVNPQTKQEQPAVKIYGSENFEGPFQELEAGTYNIMQLTIGRDRIGSMEVPECMMIALHKESGPTGEAKAFTKDVPDLAEVFTGKAAFLTIQPVAVIYSEADYGGESRSLSVGRYDAGRVSILKKGILSLKVPRGMMITLFKDSESQDSVACFTQDAPLTGDTFDPGTEISGAAVEMIKGNPFGAALNFGDIVALKSVNGKFIRIEQDGSLTADSDYIGEKSEFVLVRCGPSRHTAQASFGDHVGLKSRDDKYLRVDKDGGASAASETISDAERFIIWRSGDTKHMSFASADDAISLQSFLNKKFVASNGIISAKSETINAAEKWQVIISEKPHHHIQL